MSCSQSMELEALPPYVPAHLHVVESMAVEPLDPFEHPALLLPGDVELATQQEKSLRYAKRLDVFTTIRAAYKGRPELTHALQRYELAPEKREHIDAKNPLRQLAIDASKYRLVSKKEGYSLAKDMERGVETFIRLGNTVEAATDEDEQAFLAHVAGHSILYHANQRLALDKIVCPATRAK